MFFVTFGKKEGGKVYRDVLSHTGVLDWDSQNRQSQKSGEIQALINSSNSERTIHLFLRARDRSPYTYFGPLQYLWHDPATSNPVHFRWRVLNWDPRVAERIGVKLGDDHALLPDHLTPVAPPIREPRDPEESEKIYRARARRGTDYGERDARNRELGRAGEDLVVKHEQETLRNSGRHDLARRVRHVPTTDGDGLGYDVLSFTADGETKYIEVKTTEGGKATPFFLSAGELAAAAVLADSYYLYRVFEYSKGDLSGKIFTLRSPLEAQVTLIPVTYKAVFVE